MNADVRPERYRSFADCPRFPLGDNAELVYSPCTPEARTLSAVSARLLQSCGVFATLEDHASRLCREFNLRQDQWTPVLTELSALVKMGLLLSQTDLQAYCRKQLTPGPAAAPITTVGIPTRNRAASLERCLDTYLACGQQNGRSNDHVVVDDSDDPQVRDQNRAMLQSLRDRYGATIFYAGPEDKARFADVLIHQAGLPAEAVRFGLLNPEGCPIATGGSRNLLLLHTVGEILLQVDDDTLGRLAPPPECKPGLAFSSRFDPTEFWFLNEEEALATEPAAGEDLLAVHEQLLGRSLGDCLDAHAAGTEVDLEHTGTTFFRKLGSGAARVLVTSAGVVGDSGMGSSLFFLSLEGNSRARLLRSEQDYRRALAVHQVMRSVTRLTVCEGAFCMALNLGLDNRQLLPPFMPVQRNQDGIFAALLRACRADAFFGFLPRVLLHKPPARPQRAPAASWKETVRLRSGQILQTVLRSLPFRPAQANPARNLRELGKAVTELASLPRPEFEETVRIQVWNQMSKQAMQLAVQLRQFAGQPDFWANDVRQMLAALGEELPRNQYIIPLDLAAEPNDCHAAELFQRLALRLGQLLQVWPDMVEAARDLRSRGVRPASKI